MRNLKKVLSLVLCVAMMLSVMVVGAGAAFSDQSKIKNTEAVDACTALNIIGGYPDGSFKPEGNITRAEVTKMICVALNGGKNPAVSTNTTPTFSDVRNNANAAWAEGYIESCAAQGIVSGVGGGKFAPNGNVTGVQLAKMLLVSLGYKSENEGFTGNAWATNVNVRAAQKGLYDGLKKMDTNAALTRDNAAQMVWNALNAYEVEYKTTLVADSKGQLSSQITVQDKVVGSTNDKITLLEDKYEADTAIGTFAGNSDVTNCKDGNIQITDATINGATVRVGSNNKTTFQFKYDLDLKYLGEEVKVLYKDSKDGVDGQLDEKDTIYGVYVTGTTTVYNITKGDLQSCSDAGKIKFGDKKYDVASFDTADTNKVVIVKNNDGQTAIKVDDLATGSNNGATAAQFANYINNPANGLRVNSNDAIKFVCNDDGKIVMAYVTNSRFGKVSSVTSSKIGIEGLGTKDLEDCVAYDGIKAGDIVNYVDSYGDSSRKYIITKAETVSGKIEAFKSSDSQIKVDGKWYKYDSVNTTVATDYTQAALTSSDVDDTYDLIVYGNYYVAYNKVSGFNNYAIATKGTTEFGDTRVKLLKADGSETTSTVDELKDGATLPSSTTKTDAVLYSYNLKSSDSKVDLSAKDYTKVSSANYSFNGDSDTLTVNGSSKIVASDAAVFVYVGGTDNKWKAYTASSLGSFSGSSSDVQYIVDNNKIVAFAVKANSFPTGGSNTTAYGYVTNRVDTKIGDDNVVQLTIWNGTDEVALNIDGTSCNAYIGDFVEYPIIDANAKANNSDVKVETTASGSEVVGSTYFKVVKIKTVESDRIITTTDTVAANGQVVDGQDTAWTLTSSTKKIGVNTADNEKSDNNSIIAYTKTAGEDYANAAIFYEVKSGYNEIKAIFIDSDNKLIPYNQGNAQPPEGRTATYAVTPASVTTAVKGLTATVTADKAYARNGETVTVTVTVSGTATAPGAINVSGVTATAVTMGTLTNATINGTTGVKITAASAATNGTFTYNFTMGTSAVTPTVTIS